MSRSFLIGNSAYTIADLGGVGFEDSWMKQQQMAQQRSEYGDVLSMGPR